MSVLLGGAAPSSATRATQVAAIKALLLGSEFLKTASGGDKYVLANHLVELARQDLLLISTTDQVPAERQAAVLEAAKRVPLVPLIEPWMRLVSRQSWTSSAAWPSSSDQSTEEKTAAFIKIADSLKTLSNRLSSHYEGLKASLVASVPQAYDENVPGLLPEPVTRNQDARSYVVTYTTDWGWESEPSEPSELKTVDDNDIATLVAPAPPAGRNVAAINFYRTATGTGDTDFQFVSTLEAVDWTNASTRTLVDTKKQAELGDVLITFKKDTPGSQWSEPPADMKGLKALPNGVLIGFDDNQLYFSESFAPYAWPSKYWLTTEHKIVGIGTFGQTAVVLTEGFPYYVSGADAMTMSAQKLEYPQSCVSKRTIASVDGGVIFASPDGICLASSSGIQNLLQGAVSRADWQSWMGASNTWVNAFGAYHEGIYYMFNSAGAGYALDLASKKISNFTQVCTGAYSDLITDKLYVVSGTTLIDLFGGASFNTGVWRSKKFVNQGYTAFGCLKVESNFESPVTVKVYGEGVLVHTATFTNANAQRLPPGRYRELEFQIEAACSVTALRMATSMQELAAP
jgi:hypothetical protein